jgi:putative endonuclease
MTFRRDLGDFGERVAAAHLESKGYRILARNYRILQGEVDLVAQRDGVVAFVEVKTRKGNAMGTAVQALLPRQQQRLVLAAEAFSLERDDLPDGRRIDVIAIDLDSTGRVLSVEHIEDAIEAT